MNIHGTSNTGSNSDTVVILTRNRTNCDTFRRQIKTINVDHNVLKVLLAVAVIHGPLSRVLKTPQLIFTGQ